MKTIILISSLSLAIATTLSVWAHEAHQPESSGQPAIEITQDKIDSSIVTMEELRLKMTKAPSPTEQKALIQELLQNMKDSMKMLDRMENKKDHLMEMILDMKSQQEIMQGKMEIIIEMMRGILIQQELMMKSNDLISI
jgi:hypothetical protein